MSKAQAPKLRKFLWGNLVDKTDPDAKSTIVTEYKFSNGRVFKRNLSRNRTA